MKFNVGTIYRGTVQIGEDPAPCTDEVVFLRWGYIRGTTCGWTNERGEVFTGVFDRPRAARLRNLPLEWKEVLATEILDAAYDGQLGSVPLLRCLFPRKLKRRTKVSR